MCYWKCTGCILQLIDASPAVERFWTESESYTCVIGDPIMAFGGPDMKRLMRAVEGAVNQGRFHRPPLGPVGSLLTLTDETWAMAVEVGLLDHLLHLSPVTLVAPDLCQGSAVDMLFGPSPVCTRPPVLPPP